MKFNLIKKCISLWQYILVKVVFLVILLVVSVIIGAMTGNELAIQELLKSEKNKAGDLADAAVFQLNNRMIKA